MKRILLSGLLCLILMPAFLCAKSKKTALKVGDEAPNFTLTGDDGKQYQLSDFNDQKVVLYFYPFDYSPGCTKQACSVARGNHLYAKHNIKVFGINHQSIKTHASFKKFFNLPFTLLSDRQRSVTRAYGAHSFLLTKRITILIDRGKVVSVLHKIDVNNHADQIIEAFGLA